MRLTLTISLDGDWAWRAWVSTGQHWQHVRGSLMLDAVMAECTFTVDGVMDPDGNMIGEVGCDGSK